MGLGQTGLQANKGSLLRHFGWGYLVLSVFVALSRIFDWEVLQYISKPLIMLSLICLYVTYRPERIDVQYRWVLAAMIGSLSGDICLMFAGDLWFLLGLGSFLIAHIGYIVAFQYRTSSDSASLLRRRPLASIPFFVYAGLLLWIILPGAAAMQLPVILYATAILLMAFSSLNRWTKVTEESFSSVFLGALLFLISDSMIAMDRFAATVMPIPGVETWIILTYMAAQYLIITGLLRQDWYLYSRK